MTKDLPPKIAFAVFVKADFQPYLLCYLKAENFAKALILAIKFYKKKKFPKTYYDDFKYIMKRQKIKELNKVDFEILDPVSDVERLRDNGITYEKETTYNFYCERNR